MDVGTITPLGATEDTRAKHMTDQPRRPDAGDDDGKRYDDEPSTGIPRWVRVVGIILAVAALLVVIVLLVGGGHGPRRHGSPGSGQAPPAGVIEVHELPEDNR